MFLDVAHRYIDVVSRGKQWRSPANVRYCNDRLVCRMYALGPGPWTGSPVDRP